MRSGSYNPTTTTVVTVTSTTTAGRLFLVPFNKVYKE